VPTAIHDSEGLRIHKNDANGFVVCRLHYTADPRKRSEEWRAAAQMGMSKAQFEQEFEINYAAHMGERVFPEIRDKRHEIVLSESPYEFGDWPKHLQMWGGFDYGSKNPSSFHVYTIVDGVIYAIWEMYEPCKNIRDFTAAMKDCPYWSQVRWIAHDPDMNNLKQRDLKTGGMTTVRRQFEELGINKWVPGNNNEQAWLVQMQKHWSGREITFKILQCCPKMIDEFENATFVGMTERQLETQNYREAVLDKNNHAMDDCKYFMNVPRSESVSERKAQKFNAGESYSSGGPTPRAPWGRERELGLVV
jgi:hypothetical protein